MPAFAGLLLAGLLLAGLLLAGLLLAGLFAFPNKLNPVLLLLLFPFVGGGAALPRGIKLLNVKALFFLLFAPGAMAFTAADAACATALTAPVAA
jgi:hypothetical protein